MNKTNKIAANENIDGLKTQNQFQLITPQSFKTMKTIVNNPTNPILPEPEELLLLCITSPLPYVFS